jgi:hypothetical protein
MPQLTVGQYYLFHGKIYVLMKARDGFYTFAHVDSSSTIIINEQRLEELKGEIHEF